jgi:hypothetical protein
MYNISDEMIEVLTVVVLKIPVLQYKKRPHR